MTLVREYTDAGAMLADYAARRARFRPVARVTRIAPVVVVPPVPPASYTPRPALWTPDEDAALVAMVEAGVNAYAAAAATGRSVNAVINRSRRIGHKISAVRAPAAPPADMPAPDAIGLYRLVADTSTTVYRRGDAHRIMREVATAHGLIIDDLRSECRNKVVVAARHEAMWRIAWRTMLPLAAIGRLFGRGHTSVRHAIQSVNGRTGENVRGIGGVPDIVVRRKRSAALASLAKARAYA